MAEREPISESGGASGSETAETEPVSESCGASGSGKAERQPVGESRRTSRCKTAIVL